MTSTKNPFIYLRNKPENARDIFLTGDEALDINSLKEILSSHLTPGIDYTGVLGVLAKTNLSKSFFWKDFTFEPFEPDNLDLFHTLFSESILSAGKKADKVNVVIYVWPSNAKGPSAKSLITRYRNSPYLIYSFVKVRLSAKNKFSTWTGGAKPLIRSFASISIYPKRNRQSSLDSSFSHIEDLISTKSHNEELQKEIENYVYDS